MSIAGEAVVRIRADASGLPARVEAEGLRAGKGFSSGFNKGSKGTFTHIEKEMGQATRGAAAATGAFSHLGRSLAFASATFLGTAKAVDIVRTSIGLAADEQKQLERATALFGSAAGNVKKFADNAANSIALSRDQTLKFTNNLGQMLTLLGKGPAATAAYSVELTKMAANLAAIRHEDPESVLAKLTAGLRGRGGALKTYGILINEATLKEEALRQGWIKQTADAGKVGDARLNLAIKTAQLRKAEQEHTVGSTQLATAQGAVEKAQRALDKAVAGSLPNLTAIQRQQAAVNIILEKAAGINREAGKHTGDLADKQAKLHAQIQNLEADLGRALIPTVTKVVTAFSDWFSKTENQERVQRDITKAVEEMNSVLGVAWGVIQTGTKVLKPIVDAFGGLGNVLKVIVAFKIGTFVAASVTKLAILAESWLGVGAAATTAATETTVATGVMEADMVALNANRTAALFSGQVGGIGTAATTSATKVGKLSLAVKGLSELGSVVVPIAILATIDVVLSDITKKWFAKHGWGAAAANEKPGPGAPVDIPGGVTQQIPGTNQMEELIPVRSGGKMVLYGTKSHSWWHTTGGQPDYGSTDPNKAGGWLGVSGLTLGLLTSVAMGKYTIAVSKRGPSAAAAAEGASAQVFPGSQYGVATHGTQTPRRIILHSTESPSSTAASVAAGWKSDGKGYGAQYVIDSSGKITQLAADRSVTYHTGGANTGSIGIEIAGMASWTRAQWLAHPKQMAAVGALIKSLSAKYNIPIQLSTESGISTHAMQSKIHSASQGHWDPGPGFPLDLVLGGSKGMPPKSGTGPLYGSALKAAIARTAVALGLDPAAALAVATGEGGFGGAVGDHGHAFGPFQLNNAGGIMPKGRGKEWANTIEAVKFFLKGVEGQGLTGVEAILAVIQHERPKQYIDNLRKGMTKAAAAMHTHDYEVAAKAYQAYTSLTGADPLHVDPTKKAPPPLPDIVGIGLTDKLSAAKRVVRLAATKGDDALAKAIKAEERIEDKIIDAARAYLKKFPKMKKAVHDVINAARDEKTDLEVQMAGIRAKKALSFLRAPVAGGGRGSSLASQTTAAQLRVDRSADKDADVQIAAFKHLSDVDKLVLAAARKALANAKTSEARKTIQELIDTEKKNISDIATKIGSLKSQWAQALAPLNAQLAQDQADTKDVLGTLLSFDPKTVVTTSDKWGRAVTETIGAIITKGKAAWAMLQAATHSSSQKVKQAALDAWQNWAAEASAAVGTGLSAAAQAAAAASTAFDTAFSRVSSRILTAFDRITAAGVASIQASFQSQIQAVQSAAASQIASLQSAAENQIKKLQERLQKEIKKLQEKLQKDIEKLERERARPTIAEKRLTDFQAGHGAQQDARSLSDAQQGLAMAHLGGDPAEIKAAARALDDFLFAQTEATLQKSAESSRKAEDDSVKARQDALTKQEQAQEESLQKQEAAAEAQIQKELEARIAAINAATEATVAGLQAQEAAAELEYQDRRANERTLLEDTLAGWAEKLRTGKATMAEFEEWLKKEAPGMALAGKTLGSAFSEGWLTEIARARQALVSFLALAGVSGINPPSSSSGSSSSNQGSGTGQQGCFVAGTLIATPRGEIPIEELRAGDSVLSWDFTSDAVVTAPVEQLYIHADRETLVVETEAGEVTTTAEHPFYVGMGWRQADALDGYFLHGFDGENPQVLRIRSGGNATVYNLHVGHNDHNYFAGGFLVHNKVAFLAGGEVPGSPTGRDDKFILASGGETVIDTRLTQALKRVFLDGQPAREGNGMELLVQLLRDGNVERRKQTALLERPLPKPGQPQKNANDIAFEATR